MADCKVADETTNYKVASKVIENNSKKESNEFMLNDIIKRKILGEYELQKNRSKCSTELYEVESIDNNSAND